MDKKTLRKSMKSKRDELSSKDIHNLSDKVISRILDSDEYNKSENIFAFVSFGSEVFTHNFIKSSILNNKNIYIPYIKNNEMYAVKLKDFNDLELGYYDILSLPENKIEIVDKKIIDLILVPGLIFDKNFYRIGYGGGYYDKFMNDKDLNAYKIGICFDFQVVETVEPQSHDIPVDKIITEMRIIERN